MDLISIWMIIALIGVVLFVLVKMLNTDGEAFDMNQDTHKKVGEIEESLHQLHIKINKPSQYIEKEYQPKRLGRPRGSKTMKGVK